MKEKELLKWLDLVFCCYSLKIGKGFDIHIPHEDFAKDEERSEQAYQQIRKLIMEEK